MQTTFGGGSLNCM